MSKKYYDNFVQHTIYFEPSTYDTIKILASKKKQSITETVRILLESGINHELLAKVGYAHNPIKLLPLHH